MSEFEYYDESVDCDGIAVLTARYQPWVPPAAPGGLELDLGCGKGGFALGLAARYPDRNILAADVMLGRLRKLRNKARHDHLANVVPVRGAAWELIGYLLPDACLDRVHILCPDPWPKTRHRANRLVTSEFLGRLAAKLKPGGALHLATDNEPYLEQMLAAIRGLAGYRPWPEGIADIRDLQTDFERVFARIDRPVHHHCWQRQ